MKHQGNLQIIAGEDRGRRLKSPKNDAIRPTASMAREAIFSILRDRVPGCRFLDLYAGTGAVGLEALSRGAKTVTLVENHHSVHPLLEESVKAAVRPNDCQVWTSSVLTACEGFVKRKRVWDLIFVDPPYDNEGVRLSHMEPLLGPAGILLFQRPCKRAVGDPFQGTSLVRCDLRRYGKTEVGFWMFPDNLEEE